MKKILLAGLVLIFGTIGTAQPQHLDKSTGTEVEVCSIDSIFNDINCDDSPGCSVGVFRAGEIIFSKGYGMASLEHNISLSPNSKINLGSVSKQFTALSVILLDQKGKLSIDDPIRKYLPELPEYAAPVTIRHLIHHTGGIRDNVALLRLARGQVESDSDEVIKSMLEWQSRLNFNPGENFMYSSAGYSLLAMIVERVSGKSFKEFTKQEIFDPLGMESSRFLSHATSKNRALAYVPYGDNKYRLSIPTHSLVGTTGLYTTIEDLAKWDKNFYDMQVGGSEGISLMQIPGRLNSGQELSYASGLLIDSYRGLKTVWHGGFDPGYTSMLLRFPEEHLTVAILCNITSANPWERAYKVADLYLGNEMDEEQVATGLNYENVTLSHKELEVFTGIYKSRDGIMVQSFDEKDGQLIATIGNTQYPLSHIGNRQFSDGITHYVLSFTESGEGDAMTASWSPNPRPIKGDSLKLDRISPRWNPVHNELSEFTGSFFNEELDANWKIVQNDDGLVLKRWGIEDQFLEPLNKDVFAFKGNTSPRLEFKREDNGRINHIEVSNEQILGIKFLKRN
ncbi:serine hydrolase domain-containing protein [Cyclobacterium salsum]|uniref:serine hydrolase domain-containing protein n=1 Tax=Cyclobacterium salsum TaxID=2666329 RepID=UPI0013919F20|nr:serine hydrolase domain-containing protein [Cyclobacterium salsum]